jgi:gluconate 2-dehydrogenase gamma chain
VAQPDNAAPHPVSDPALSRRWFVSASFATVAVTTAGWWSSPIVRANGLEPTRPAPPSRLPLFFNAPERAFIVAATSRLIPTDDTGPGAKEADVVTFIDRQLAGPYGRGDGWYLEGPFAAGTIEQGWQTNLTPAQLYRMSIHAVDTYCTRTFSGVIFARISDEQQDVVLRGLQRGEIALGDLSAKTFFQLLHQNTIEGFFSDPAHGGNRDFVGWKMISYPGVRYDWRPWVAQHGKRVDWPVVGLYGPVDHYGLKQP